MGGNFGPDYTETDIRGVLNLLEVTVRKILLRGSSVVIDDFIKIKPKIKAVTKLTEEGTLETERPLLSATCSVSSEFIKSLQKQAVIEQVDNTSVIPQIKNIFGTINKKQVLQSRFINNINGTKLKSTKYELSGLKIVNNEEGGESVTFTLDQIALDYHTDRLIVFTFKDQSSFPPWLINDRVINVSLLYSQDGRGVETEGVTTTWVLNDQ